METRDDLLQPTLGRSDSPAISIYSARTGYFVSFFGGPIAGAAIALANAHRLKRLAIDWPLGLLAAGTTAVSMWWWLKGGGDRWVASHVGPNTSGLMLRVLGLGFFALVYGWHRQYYRNMELFGLKAPSGWVIGVAAVIGGLAASFGLAYVLS